MADNRDSRYLRKDAPVFAENDPLAELARIAGLDDGDSVRQPVQPQGRQEPEFTFDLEAELLAQLDPQTDFYAAAPPHAVSFPDASPAEPLGEADAPSDLGDLGDLTDLPPDERRPMAARDDMPEVAGWKSADDDEDDGSDILFALDEADLAGALDEIEAPEPVVLAAPEVRPDTPPTALTAETAPETAPAEHAPLDLEAELEQAFFELQRRDAVSAPAPQTAPVAIETGDGPADADIAAQTLPQTIVQPPTDDPVDIIAPADPEPEGSFDNGDGAEEELADLVSEAAFAQDSAVASQPVVTTDRPSIEPYWNEDGQGIDFPDVFSSQHDTDDLQPDAAVEPAVAQDDLQEPLDIAFDFDDLALELEGETDAQPAMHEPAAPAYVTADRHEDAPVATASAEVTPVSHGPVLPLVAPALAARAVYPAVEPPVLYREAEFVDQTSAAVSPMAVDRDADISFDRGDIADTGSFIEPVGEIEVPDLPDFDEPPVIAHESELEFDLETEFNALREQELADSEDRAAASEPAAPLVTAAAASVAVPRADAAATTATRSVDIDDIDFSTFDFSTGEGFRQAGHAGATPAAFRPSVADDLSFDDFEHAPPPAPRRMPNNRVMLLASVALAVVLGGGALAWGLMGGGTDSGEPLIIAADTDPIKVVPADPGGRTVPNQDIAVYEQVDGSANPVTPTLMSRSEEPVDVVQRTLDPSVLPFDQLLMTAPDNSEYADDDADLLGSLGEGSGQNDIGPGDSVDSIEGLIPAAENTPSDDQGSVAVAARRVQTMVVRADGTLVPRTPTAPQAAADEGTSLEAAVADTAGDEIAAQGTQPSTTAGNVPIPARRPGEAVAERLAPTDPAGTQAAEAPLVAPVRTVQTTSTTPPAVAPPPPASADSAALAAPATTAPVAAPSSDAYYIQISSQPTQASAQESYQNLSQRHAGIIGGRAVQIQPAVIPDRGTFYRVRIAAGSRDEANALCQSYQAAGGSCFVAR